VADVNGDGLPDLLVANSTAMGAGNASVLLGTATGFAPHVGYPIGLMPSSIIATDLRGNGVLDLVVANHDGNSVSVLLGKGDGTFQAKTDAPVAALPSAVIAADVNGDQKLDLVVTNQGDRSVSVLLGNGDGSFQAKLPDNAPTALAVVDVAVDGVPDLIVTADDVAIGVLSGTCLP
jgi:hypothetical protein